MKVISDYLALLFKLEEQNGLEIDEPVFIVGVQLLGVKSENSCFCLSTYLVMDRLDTNDSKGLTLIPTFAGISGMTTSYIAVDLAVLLIKKMYSRRMYSFWIQMINGCHDLMRFG